MSQLRPTVAVIGNIGVDSNAYLPGHEIDWSVEANFTENLDYVGQAGGFASRGYAQLGFPTTFLGYVGDDFCGQMVRDALTHDRIDTTALFVDPAGTSRSLNIMGREGGRKNFYDAKSHMALKPDLEQCRKAMKGCRLAHFNIPNWARTLLPVAREMGITIACDLQDVVKADDPYRSEFIAQADILFFSAVNHGDPSPLMRKFLKGNPGRIVVSGMGAKGCALATRESIEFFPPPPVDLPILDTNGAGDGLAVGFLSSYILQGYSLGDSIRRGQIAARHTCAQRANTDSLITLTEMDRHFAAFSFTERY